MESMTTLRGRIPSVLLAALVLALSRLHSTGAVDCLFYSQLLCQGTGVGCYGLAENVCCGLPAALWRRSLRVQNSNSCKSTTLYTGGFCTTEYFSSDGTFCASGFRFTGGRWNRICRRRQLLADVSNDEQQACTDDSSGCKNVMDPNAIVYNSGEGNWMLIKDNAMGLYEQLTNVPDSEKVAWLTAQGATYTSKTEEKMINVAN
ncbi:hypothetical protein MPTK1_8g16670 [Marchantia polymorpha subsp. ruderalis]|uniref:Uncharacterized protein n=1 Tax=Marchantia polymorpha TaxID=3197 RepID=A0A2R6X813_MARPO|nr:hypothetical protein MARPO_0030s0002 [Marchantia polymorpha]BBN20130.1 hypothetical protein Mp_8g16670 [Marchantia polymorpha subsp. ruderalis]|eukprot:PTQ42246.1 hypothetical protein MARPO_0030s0002 [Marchantia polymorpha]